MIAIAEPAFERWHQRLIEAAQFDGGWELHIHAPYRPKDSAEADFVVVHEDGIDRDLGVCINSEKTGKVSHIPWHLKSYLRMTSERAQIKAICAHSRQSLLPHHEGEFASDMAALALAGVLYHVVYRPPGLERVSFLRKRLRALCDDVVYGSSDFLLTNPLLESRFMAGFLSVENRTLESDLAYLARATKAYLRNTEPLALERIKKVRRWMELMEEGLIKSVTEATPRNLEESSYDDPESEYEDSVDTAEQGQGSDSDDDEEDEDVEAEVNLDDDESPEALENEANSDGQ